MKTKIQFMIGFGILIILKFTLYSDPVPFIPAYPGLKSYQPQKGYDYGAKIIQETLRGQPGGMPILSSTVDCYFAEAKRDDVFQFFQKNMNGSEILNQKWPAIDPLPLNIGTSTPVTYEKVWVSGGTVYTFHWYQKADNGDVTLFEISICKIQNPVDASQTGDCAQVVITKKVYSETVARIIPSEKDLGAPVYPGSVYASQISSAMGSSIFYHYFFSKDSMEKTVSFYEKAFGKKAFVGQPVAGGSSYYFTGYSTDHPNDILSIEEKYEDEEHYKTKISFALNHSE